LLDERWRPGRSRPLAFQIAIRVKIESDILLAGTDNAKDLEMERQEIGFDASLPEARVIARETSRSLDGTIRYSVVGQAHLDGTTSDSFDDVAIDGVANLNCETRNFEEAAGVAEDFAQRHGLSKIFVYRRGA
jgi:hypothetical protein